MKTEEVLEREGSKYFVTDPETGIRLELKGYGSMKGMLDLDPSVDLTKPIWDQVFGHERNPFAPEEAPGNAASTK